MIYHIAFKSIWDGAKSAGEYAPESFANEKFIHCAKWDQIIGVTERHYKGKDGLVLLEIDEDKLVSRVIFEDLKGRKEKFPHIYGAINTNAVVNVFLFSPNKDGAFELPRR